VLTNMSRMLIKARQNRYALGGFEFWSLDSAFAVTEAANQLHTDVILQVGHYERDYLGGYPNARNVAEMAADRFGLDMALHLDHAESYDEILQALDAGFTSVMIDGSALPFGDNVLLTKRVVETARRYGASVEAELGRLAGDEGGVSSERDAQTDPLEAHRFVEETGVDALAVAIGTAHGFYKRTPRINIERLREIAQVVDIPLVLHGGSGTPEDKVAESILYGIAKVNICTEFIDAYKRGYLNAASSDSFSCNVPGLFAKGQESAEDLVKRKLSLFLTHQKKR